MAAHILNPGEEPILQLSLKQATDSGTLAEFDLELRTRLESEVEIALCSVQDPTVRETLQTVFNEILTVFDRLAVIEKKLQELDTLLESLSVLELLQFEIRYLVDFIERRAMPIVGSSQILHSALDGLSYSMAHDVKRVFERELTSEVRTQSIPVVYGKILHSHGLLANCFQQAIISMLQVLNPGLDAINLFNDFEERQRQSLLLCNDLSALIRVVEQAESHPDAETYRAVVQKTIEFRDGSMQYLMYRDWRAYEDLAFSLITTIESDGDAADQIHQFRCYLEVLFGHVKMRAALKELFPNSE